MKKRKKSLIGYVYEDWESRFHYEITNSGDADVMEVPYAFNISGHFDRNTKVLVTIEEIK